MFTGIGRRVELVQAFRDAALVLNKDLKIHGADMTCTAPALAFCDHSHKVVSMNDPNYIQNILEICQREQIDLLIPTIDTDLIILSESRETFERIGTRVMVSAPETIRVCRNKHFTAHFFEDCGLHTPFAVSDWHEYRGGFPAFIKPKDGSNSVNAYKVEDREELEVYANQIVDPIIQPFIQGIEYTIDVLCDWHGKPLSVVPRERLQVRSGEVLKTRITLDPFMIEEAKQICRALSPCGPVTIQLIRDTDRIDWFIEINPRFGGGAPLSMKAGARSAELVLRMLDGEAIEDCPEIADGAIYSRFDQSVCISEGKNRIKGVIFDLDDTLYSEKEYVRSGFKAVSNYLGGGYEEKLWMFFQHCKPAIDFLLKELRREDEKTEVVSTYRNHMPTIHMYSGVIELIKELRLKGIKTGVITDGRPEGQHNKIQALGLDKLVDDIIITDELGGAQFRKPCDISFRIMQRRWKIPASQMIYIGDNPEKDFQAPKQLGMRCICLVNNEGVFAKAYEHIQEDVLMVSSLQELLTMLHDLPEA